MTLPSLTLVLLSLLSTYAFAQTDPKSLPDDVLPAAKLTSDPLDRNLTTVEITLEAPAVPSFTNSTEEGVVQTVSYFVVEGANAPLAIIYGDVILSTVPELLENLNPNNASSKVKRALSIFKTDNIWPGGVVNYKWQSEDAKGAGRLREWTEATKRWTDMLPWLVFKEFPVGNNFDPDVLTLVPTTGQFACFSPIGKGYGGQMLLDDACGGAGTYAHELGHTLGLYHEHMRPDRDNYVKINCENVWDSPDGTPADCSQNCRGYGCNFVKLNPDFVDWSGPYDSLSLMHYSPYEFSKGPGPALEALPGVPTPQAHTFPTALDAKRVCELYSEKCTGICGDGILTAGEECDDGNNRNGDGCSSDCKIEGNNPNPGTCKVSACDPWSATSCDISTTCTALGGATSGGVGQHMCACRHGYRASGATPGDDSVQVRLPWVQQGGRVFVKPGVECNQLCDEWTLGKDGCKEVKEVPACY